MRKTILTKTLRPRLLLIAAVLLCAGCTGQWRHLPVLEWRLSMALVSGGMGGAVEPVFRVVRGWGR